MVRMWLGSDFGARINFLLSFKTRQMMRQRIHTMLFCRTKTAKRQAIPSRHSLLVTLQQYMAAMRAKLRVSVQSRKLKKYIVGVIARFRARMRLLGQGYRKSQIFKTQTMSIFEKMSTLIPLMAAKDPGKKIQMNLCIRYNPGGVVILSSHRPKSFLRQCKN